MPAKGIDPNASSPNRIRRNFQRLAELDLAGAITLSDTSLKLTNGSLSVNVDPNGGLQTLSTGLGVKLAPNGGLSEGSTGVFASGFRLAATSPLLNDGDTYYNSALGYPVVQSNGLLLNLSGKLYASTADSNTISNVLTGVFTGTTFTFPANFFTVGRVVEIFVGGNVSCLGSNNIALDILVGSIDSGSVITVTPPSSNLGRRLFAVMRLVCRATGTSGVLQRAGYGLWEQSSTVYNVQGGSFFNAPTGTSTIDTTSSQTVSLQVTWSAASSSNTAVIEQLLITALN